MARRQKTSADTPGEGQQGKDKDKGTEKAADKGAPGEPSKSAAPNASLPGDPSKPAAPTASPPGEPGKPAAPTAPTASPPGEPGKPASPTASPPGEPGKPASPTASPPREPSKPAAPTASPPREPSKPAAPDAPPSEHDAKTQPIAAQRDSDELPAIEPPAPHAEPWPDATPAPMKPVAAAAQTARAPTETMAMAPLVDVGKPPEMPQSTAPRPLALGDVENPAHMPGPKDIPAGNPDDPAPAPGLTPPGDSRSFRRGNQFALVYRVGTCVISRTGVIGTRGQWRVVEYPTSASASSSYAHECSRFVSEGFSDYRD